MDFAFEGRRSRGLPKPFGSWIHAVQNTSQILFFNWKIHWCWRIRFSFEDFASPAETGAMLVSKQWFHHWYLEYTFSTQHRPFVLVGEFVSLWIINATQCKCNARYVHWRGGLSVVRFVEHQGGPRATKSSCETGRDALKLETRRVSNLYKIKDHTHFSCLHIRETQRQKREKLRNVWACIHAKVTCQTCDSISHDTPVLLFSLNLNGLFWIADIGLCSFWK